MAFLTISATFVLCCALLMMYMPLPLPPPYNNYYVEKTPMWTARFPLTEELNGNIGLETASLLFENKVEDPETIQFDAHGNMYLFTENGILRSRPNALSFEDPTPFLAINGSRPLSGAFDSDGDLYVCDPIIGLVKINRQDRGYDIVVPTEDVYYCDDVVVSSKGDVYIADGMAFKAKSPQQMPPAVYSSIFQGGRYGRILKYTPSTRVLESLVEGITFATGVELSSDETYLLFSDALAARVLKYWLEGPLKGKTETFVQHSYGYVDGIKKGSNSTYWMAVPTPVGRIWKLIFSSCILRWAASYIHTSYVEKFAHWQGVILHVDVNGSIIQTFSDASGRHGRPTSAIERDGKVYIGTFDRLVKVINLRSI